MAGRHRAQSLQQRPAEAATVKQSVGDRWASLSLSSPLFLCFPATLAAQSQAVFPASQHLLIARSVSRTQGVGCRCARLRGLCKGLGSLTGLPWGLWGLESVPGGSCAPATPPAGVSQDPGLCRGCRSKWWQASAASSKIEITVAKTLKIAKS